MDTNARHPSKNPVALGLKALGYLTSPTSRPGRLFKRWEDLMTGAVNKLATNDTYLNQAGRAMERAFVLRAQWNRSFETMLRLWRMPTTTDMDDLRDHLRHLNDQVEALSSQLELMLEGLDRGQGSGGQAQARQGGLEKNGALERSEAAGPRIVVPPMAEAAPAMAEAVPAAGRGAARATTNGTPRPVRSSPRRGQAGATADTSAMKK